MSKSELKDIWQQAAENAKDEDANNYFDKRTVKIDGVPIGFTVDTESAIYYATEGSWDGLADDLVYAIEHPEGTQHKTLQSAEEFIERVEDFVDSLDVKQR